MGLENLKPLPKEKTPPPIVIEPRKKEEDLPKVEEEVKEEIKEENNEKTSDEEIKNLLKDSDEGDKPDASAVADAIIMSHNAKTKQSSKNGVKTICALLLGVIALAVLLLSGVLNPKGSEGGGGQTPTPSDNSSIPTIKNAKAVCEKHEGYIFKESSIYGIEFEGYETQVREQDICMYDTESGGEHPENTFEFTYTRLADKFEEIEGFRDHLKSVSVGYDVLEDSTDFYKSFMPSSTYYYISVYRKALITLSASDIDTAEELLKDLHFPDRSHATED